MLQVCTVQVLRCLFCAGPSGKIVSSSGAAAFEDTAIPSTYEEGDRLNDFHIKGSRPEVSTATMHDVAVVKDALDVAVNWSWPAMATAAEHEDAERLRHDVGIDGHTSIAAGPQQATVSANNCCWQSLTIGLEHWSQLLLTSMRRVWNSWNARINKQMNSWTHKNTCMYIHVNLSMCMVW